MINRNFFLTNNTEKTLDKQFDLLFNYIVCVCVVYSKFLYILIIDATKRVREEGSESKNLNLSNLIIGHKTSIIKSSNAYNRNKREEHKFFVHVYTL